MTPCRITTWILDRRWPIGLQLLMAMTIGANAVLLYLATRPDAPVPMEGWYERAVNWDQTQALRDGSRDLGWATSWDIPAGPEYALGMPRPVDLSVKDRAGQPVRGLSGQVRAVRPADAALENEAEIFELPQTPGSYRCLLRFPADGLWELDASLHQGALTWVGSQRVDIHPQEGAP